MFVLDSGPLLSDYYSDEYRLVPDGRLWYKFFDIYFLTPPSIYIASSAWDVFEHSQSRS